MSSEEKITKVIMQSWFYEELRAEHEKLTGHKNPNTFMGVPIEVDDTITGGYDIE